MTSLFHYCSSSTFTSIISNRSIWLSSLNMSNDTMEGKLVAEIIYRLAKKDGLDEGTIKQLQAAISFLEEENDGLGFCLSENGDILSQWRGYATDATGFSIGFSKEYLSALSESLRVQNQIYFTLKNVEYDATAQEELVRPTYEKVKQTIEVGLKKIPLPPRGLIDLFTDKEVKEYKDVFQSVLSEIFMLFPKLYALKTAAFREELEWRLISYKTRDEVSCSFKALIDRIVPYREFLLPNLEAAPIIEIFIGPKNHTPGYVVKAFLEKHDFENVTISRSSATYR